MFYIAIRFIQITFLVVSNLTTRMYITVALQVTIHKTSSFCWGKKIHSD